MGQRSQILIPVQNNRVKYISFLRIFTNFELNIFWNGPKKLFSGGIEIKHWPKGG